MASAHARMGSSWLITSADVSYAALQFCSDGSPVNKFVKNSKTIAAPLRPMQERGMFYSLPLRHEYGLLK